MGRELCRLRAGGRRRGSERTGGTKFEECVQVELKTGESGVAGGSEKQKLTPQGLCWFLFIHSFIHDYSFIHDDSKGQ